MAEILNLGLVRHLRSEQGSHILHFRRARLRRSGRALSFWFMPLSASIAEIPMDDRELTLLFHGRSADFQDVTAQGVLTFRVVDPELLSRRVDFSIDLKTGVFLKQPLEKLALMMSELAQQNALAYVSGAPIRAILTEGQSAIRERVEAGLRADVAVSEMGLSVVSVRISSVKPSIDLEKALEAPMRERIQQAADEAAFARRALAVEKERAIQENELQNRIELARREEQLIAQSGANARRQASEEAEAARIAAEADAARTAIAAQAKGERTRVEAEGEAVALKQLESVRVDAERARMAFYGDVSPAVLLGLAAERLAGKLEKIEHLNVTPDLVAPLFANLLAAGARKLNG